MDFRQLQKERARFTHHPLLDVKVGKFLERTNFFRGEFSDAFVNGNGLGEEAVADKNLREALEIIDGLESFALPNVQLPDRHQGDLIAGLKFKDLLVFGDSLRNFALI